MPQQSEQIEQLAQKIWSMRSYRDVWRIAEQCGCPSSEINWTEWDQLPENVRDHVRNLAGQEIAFKQTLPEPGEIEQYLTALFRELERLRPTKFGVTSHGIVWDEHWERMTLLINIGDGVYLHPLRPGDLSNDPIATAASLAAKVAPHVDREDADIVVFKR